MKNIQFFLPLFLIAVLLGGCPYSSKVGIDTPSEKVSTALVGKWQKEGSSEVYNITQEDNFHYLIKEDNPGKDKQEIYVAYVSMVDGESFLNLTKPVEGGEFYLYKLTLNDNKITLREVTENITEEFTSSAELKAFISKNKGLSFFYTKGAEVYSKAD